MKIPVTLMFLCVAFTTVPAQKNYTTATEVFSSPEITFYGYDFSRTKLLETKRIGEDLSQYVFGWVGFLQERINEEKLTDWFRKKRVNINFAPTMELNKKVNGKEIPVYAKNVIPQDSIQFIINNYQVSEKEGIGLAVIVELFDKTTVMTSAYFTFFGIATKKVLISDYVVGKEADGYGLTTYWGTSVLGLTKTYAGSYRKRIKRMIDN